MVKKFKAKTNETEKFSSGDVIETDKGEKFELDTAQADELNKQVEDSIKPAKNTGNFNKVNKRISGTFRFQQKFKEK